MNGRMLALAGPVFAVVFGAAIFTMSETPAEDASAQVVLAYSADHQGDLMVQAFLGPALAALLLLFFGALRAAARERVIAPGAGPTVMVGGAVLWASGLLLGSTLALGLAGAGDNEQPAVAETLNVLGSVSWIPFIAGIAVTLIGAGMTTLRTLLLPRWLGWLALVAGVISLAGPGGFLGFFVAPLWMLVAGILLLRQGEPAARTAETTARQQV